jgi:hypothetical protein
MQGRLLLRVIQNVNYNPKAAALAELSLSTDSEA